ncbi:MAG: YaiO family outer membrane beta-barrel protein [Desulfohalobiaceae bacterium]
MPNNGKFLVFFLLFAFLAASSTLLAAQGYREAMDRAKELRTSGNFNKAKNVYDKILNQHPDNADALVGRGFCLFFLDLNDRALADFQKAVRLAPNYVDAYIGQAKVYKHQGKWRNAEAVLEKCRKVLDGEEKKLRYLAVSAWREGFFHLAKRLDREYPPVDSRQLVEKPNTVYFTYSYDWVENRDDWRMEKSTFVRTVRPDLSWWVSLGRYHRYGQEDSEMGAGMSYRYFNRLGFSYDLFLSGGSNFLADQRHQPKMSFLALPSTSIGLGADFLEYDGDWAKLARLELKKNLDNWYGKYSLIIGKDSNSQNGDTSIFEVGYSREKNYRFRLGFSSGDESVEEAGARELSQDQVRSVYAVSRYFVTSSWGLIGSFSREWRDDEFFRSSASLSVFKRF